MVRILTCIFFLTSFLPLLSQKLSISAIPDSLRLDANTIVRYDTLLFEVIDVSKAIKTIKYAATLMNSNTKRYSKDYIYYDKFSRIRSIEGRVWDSEGNLIKKIKNKDISDVNSYDGFSLFNDNRVRIVDFGVYEYPYTIELSYEVEVDGLLFYPVWYPVFNENVAVESSMFVIRSPNELKPRYKTVNIGEPRIEESLTNMTYAWSIAQYPPVDIEPYGPGFFELVPLVYSAPSQFEMEGYAGSMETWKEFGLWQKSLNEGRDIISPDLSAKVKSLTDHLDSDLEKIEAVYDFVQNTTRYVSIQLGIGGWQSFPAETVEKKGYGDCKALTNYMYSILKEIGIKSHYALIRAGKNASKVKTDFPSQQFNHVILAIPQPKDTVWLECTSQTKPFGYMGTFTGNRDALLITESGGVIARTPDYNEKVNTQFRSAEVQIDKFGEGTARVNTEFKGLKYETNNLDYFLYQDKKDQKEWLYKTIDIPSFEIKDFAINQEKTIIPRAQIELDLQLPQYASVSGKRLFIPTNLMNRVSVIPGKVKKRKSEVILKHGYTEIDSIVFHLPDGVHPEYIPDKISLESQFGSYEAEVINNDGQLIFLRKLVQNPGRYPSESYDDLRNFFIEISKADNAKVVMVSST